MTSEQRPPVNNGHYFWVPKVVSFMLELTFIFIETYVKTMDGSCNRFSVLEPTYFRLRIAFGLTTERRGLILCHDDVLRVLNDHGHGALN